MAKFDLIMPKLGESIIEATITKWLVNEGETIAEDDVLVEIATDKVDSEIPSPVEGKLAKIHFQEGETVAVGTVIAIIEMEGEDSGDSAETATEKVEIPVAGIPGISETKEETTIDTNKTTEQDFNSSTRFYSPLVKSMARQESIPLTELESLNGTGKDGRLTKKDLLGYIENRKSGKVIPPPPPLTPQAPAVTSSTGDELIEMDRMRKLIADHMVMSKRTSPHVTMYHEVDMTRVVNWRNKVKEEFQVREGQKLTFTPIIFEAAARALRDFPLVNASVDGYTMIKRKHVNIGMATALPNGNLIVPVIKDADTKNLVGLSKSVNDLAQRARNNKLLPDEIQGGTFTITNFGQFGNISGDPIINQPQVAILGIGTIKKKPVVIETPEGDVIGIRHIMILSLAFDHRIVDGALGGMYLQRVAKYLEGFDMNRTI
ncbi:MAG: 2-oxo acid dehydrogenase subunit E2 [Chlorobi bacterium]|nr:2-oxo acid dehydrogenase subunit E2 [Chlorobiota bacterium]